MPNDAVLTPEQVLKQFTLGGFLRNARKKLGGIGEQALHTATVETPHLLKQAAEGASGLAAAKGLAKQFLPQSQEERPAEITERAGFGTPQSDPGTQLMGSVLGDPLNLVPAAPAAGRVLKAGVERFALPKIERMATASVVPSLPSVARRAGQQTLPGIEPLTAAQERQMAQERIKALRQEGEFSTGIDQRNERIWSPTRGDESDYYSIFPGNENAADQSMRRLDQYPVAPAEVTEHQRLIATMPEERSRALDTLEEINQVRDEIRRLGPETAQEDIAAAEARIAQLRGKRAGTEDLVDLADLENEILNAKRARPLISTEGEVFRADPYSSRRVIADETGGSLDPHASQSYFDPESQDAIQRIMHQRRILGEARESASDIDSIVEALRAARAGPEPVVPPQIEELTMPPSQQRWGSMSAPADKAWWEKELGVKPGENVEAFLEQAREQPNLFTYGLAPPRGADIAEHYTAEAQDAYRRGLLRKRPDEVTIDEGGGYRDYDEEPYIKQKKEHGRGELMRDRYGEYKLEEAEPGQKLYDDYGNVKKIEKDKELTGPPEEGERELWGTKEVPKRAEGGEYYRDDSGEWVYRKSRGGEPVRDYRGRVKYEEVENPDYDGSSGDATRFYLEDDPQQYIEWEPGGGAPDATAVEKGGERGSLLYQVMNSYALRHGYDIPTGGLSSSNTYRMLPNTLSTYARHGDQPRHLAGVQSGDEPSVRGRAKGADIWRAYAGATESRLPESKRITFDGKQFLVDGEPTPPEALADKLGVKKGQAGVGQKSLMARGLFRYLQDATPEEARRVAKEWSAKMGPVFSGLFVVPSVAELENKGK